MSILQLQKCVHEIRKNTIDDLLQELKTSQLLTDNVEHIIKNTYTKHPPHFSGFHLFMKELEKNTELDTMSREQWIANVSNQWNLLSSKTKYYYIDLAKKYKETYETLLLSDDDIEDAQPDIDI